MAGDEVVLLVEEQHARDVVAELNSKIDELKKEATNRPQTEKSRFPRVTKLLEAELRDSDKHYQPKIISFGPYHHGKTQLQRGETIKLKLAAAYFQLSRTTVGDCYKEIESSIKDLKGCYDLQGFTKEYEDEEFGMMMLVDGSSLLYYMLCICTGWFEEDFDISYQDLSRLNQDALSLENQLPFQLLIKLWRGKTDNLMELCLDFISMNYRDSFLKKNNRHCRLFCFLINQIINRQPQQSGQPVEVREICHLLDLFRRNILGDEGPSRTHAEDQRLKSYVSLDYFENVEDAMKGDFLSFRNVKELMAAGIHIKRSHTGCLKDISFTSNGITGCLRLPPITIDNSTKTLFFNLIAYEMSSDLPHDFISYLRFLDSLVDQADDVKELQSAGVLQNYLGSHEEVAQFFNTVSANLESNFHAYKDVSVKIRKHLKSHYHSRMKMWVTQCLDTYFGSPWTIIAWVGAALALFLTAVQTYVSVFPH